MSERTLTDVTADALVVDRYRDFVAHPQAGAVVVFEGIVRDHDNGQTGVVELEYEAHPSAADVLRDVAWEVIADQPDVYLAIAHRVDATLAVGDCALVCAVSAAHRSQAFEVSQRAIDLVKKRLPVWKRQAFTDGREEWVNCP